MNQQDVFCLFVLIYVINAFPLLLLLFFYIRFIFIIFPTEVRMKLQTLWILKSIESYQKFREEAPKKMKDSSEAGETIECENGLNFYRIWRRIIDPVDPQNLIKWLTSIRTSNAFARYRAILSCGKPNHRVASCRVFENSIVRTKLFDLLTYWVLWKIFSTLWHDRLYIWGRVILNMSFHVPYLYSVNCLPYGHNIRVQRTKQTTN